MLGKVGNGDNESLLDLLQNLLILVVGDKGDTKTLGTESSSTTDSVQVRVGIGRGILCPRMSDAVSKDETEPSNQLYKSRLT